VLVLMIEARRAINGANYLPTFSVDISTGT
jgi:hypothetical protein